MTANLTYLIIAFSISFLFSLIGTPLIANLCNRRGMFDQPNARKVHTQAIPRLGGTLFMPSMSIGVVVTLLLIYRDWNKDVEVGLSNILMSIGALLIYLIGILDDLKGMRATQKFIIQTAAALIFPACNLMISNLHGLFGVHDLPLYASYPLTVFVILLIVNAINLIDGIDGLASSLSIIILLAFAYLYHQLHLQLFCLICTALAGAVLAFFFCNFYGKVGKYKIFMGDSGSLFLGYVIAYFAIKYQMSSPSNGFPYREESLLISLSLVFLPCIDVIRVAIQRKLHGHNMFDADKTHIHHRIMQMGLDMHQALAVILCLFAAICLINFGLYVGGIPQTLILVLDVAIYSLFIWTVSNLKAQIA